ncbi:TIGR03862 family flavoprotein [Uliginosibacterium sp. H1]|uniref:TIGR03862 family flavoprotein n=1 Tax=Uliginosibacterium sp. H1 TaxID=3114757 RepID=UPI002E1807BB|nr:TIGR03862 family flavoprotein [Uliginosibacterium sp. H1]
MPEAGNSGRSTVPGAQGNASVAVIGGGPAGLMAAETMARAGLRVAVFDAMPSVGRKFLLAGVGGMNITHAEPAEAFRARYRERSEEVSRWLEAFDADALRAWVHGLGIETFVGSSGRVFPREMKAAPLLRAWLHRLRELGVSFHARHRWLGWQAGEPVTALHFATPDGERRHDVAAVVLALGGGSWSRLGSDGSWLPWLQTRGVEVAPLQAANCGFVIGTATGARGWSEHLRQRFGGQPVKTVTLSFTDAQGASHARKGEFMLNDDGVEGSLVYALSAPLRDTLAAQGCVTLHVDLLPDRSAARVLADVAHPRGSRSMASHLQSRVGIAGVKAALLRECAGADDYADPARLAAAIKALPLRLCATRPLDEAISSAGGVRLEALDDSLRLKVLPDVSCAGEMLDWEAPTGGYLLTACFASGVVAGQGVVARLRA